ncbi:hypothetical protein FQZ97_820080 [compost metagenome]
MPLKIFEKVSPFLKFLRLSSAVRVAEAPRMPSVLALLMKSGSGARTAQLAPTERVESKLPSISPMLKLTAWAWAEAPRAMAAANRWGWKAPGFLIVMRRSSCGWMAERRCARPCGHGAQPRNVVVFVNGVATLIAGGGNPPPHVEGGSHP